MQTSEATQSKLIRELPPQEDIAAVMAPFGEKTLPDGSKLNFDDLYHHGLVPAIRECGMIPERADHVFGTAQGVFDAVWKSIQRAAVVIVDLSALSANVTFELALAMVLGKRMVLLAQRLEDIPSDIRGRVRPILYSAAGVGVAAMLNQFKSELQEVRRDPVTENTLVSMKGGGTDAIAGTIVVVEKEYAVVEVDDRGQRRYCQLSNADVDYSRFIPDMTRRFKIGTRVQGAITTDFAGTTRYTLLADRINPWRGLVADYPPGTTFAGRVVHTREDLGAFVTVANGVNGLIPAEPSRRSKLAAGVEVEAEIVRVDDINRRVSLELRRVLQAPRLKMTTSATMSPNKWPVSGEKVTGVVARIVRLQDGGGYLLMRLDGYERGPLAMLHHTAMTKALREDLNVGRIDSDEELDLEVINVDPQRGRISVKDLPGAASGQADQPPPLAA